MYWLAIVLTVMANIGYHLSQKSITSDVNPYVSLSVTYAVAFAISLILAMVTRIGLQSVRESSSGS